jgi:hypothetical protein
MVQSVCLAAMLLLQPLLADAAESRALPTIEWHSSTLRLVQERGDYGRMVRLANGNLACAYDRAGKMWLRHSVDEGKSWGEPVLVAEAAECWLTNAELLVLRDGTLLYFWNERPLEAVRAQGKKVQLVRPFLIRMARSSDHGRTWSPPQTLHQAGTVFEDGCWEPAGLQLPSGEVQVYFSDESRFTRSSEQEIALLRSSDGGRTWTRRERVIFRVGHRDGMPAPLLLANGKGLVVAVEDNGYAGERFKPSICYTALADNWRSGWVSGDSTSRWPALAEPLPPEWYAGAPCLRQLPSGQTLLSFQESADGTMHRCRMAVCVGNPNARGFTNKTYPFPLGPKGNQAWNSLFVKDARTVVAISSATIEGKRGIWTIEGEVKERAP